jgi:hypothetical protein
MGGGRAEQRIQPAFRLCMILGERGVAQLASPPADADEVAP